MMKRIIYLCVCLAAVCAFSACSSQSEESSAQPESGKAESEVSITEEAIQSSTESSDESSASMVLPEGIVEYKNSFFRYTDKQSSISVIFPNIFLIEDKDYKPDNGIYLTSEDGKMTLQLESVENEGIDRDALVEYLKSAYPDADVHINDSKLVICKMKAKDKKNNEVMAYLKAAVTDDGYNEAVLYFHEEDKKAADSVFNRITVTDGLG